MDAKTEIWNKIPPKIVIFMDVSGSLPRVKEILSTFFGIFIAFFTFFTLPAPVSWFVWPRVWFVFILPSYGNQKNCHIMTVTHSRLLENIKLHWRTICFFEKDANLKWKEHDERVLSPLLAMSMITDEDDYERNVSDWLKLCILQLVLRL